VTTTPADELREAARRMRDTALAATPSADPLPGGWAGFGTDADTLGRSMLFGGPAENGYRTGTVFSTDGRCDECVGPSDADVQHIASWHPAVALAVADWLDGVAHGLATGDPDDLLGLGEPTAAFAVARAYLGTTEQVTA
jgi:hypothetical protein